MIDSTNILSWETAVRKILIKTIEIIFIYFNQLTEISRC
jgi:hypothetical protein